MFYHNTAKICIFFFYVEHQKMQNTLGVWILCKELHPPVYATQLKIFALKWPGYFIFVLCKSSEIQLL